MPTSVRRAGSSGEDIREARQESRAKYREARKVLRVELMGGQGRFPEAIKQANETFLTTVRASRETLLSVVSNLASTPEQRQAARMTYRTEVKQARQVRRTAIKVAIADFRSARRTPVSRLQGRHRQVVQHEPRLPGISPDRRVARVGDVCRPQDGA